MHSSPMKGRSISPTKKTMFLFSVLHLLSMIRVQASLQRGCGIRYPEPENHGRICGGFLITRLTRKSRVFFPLEGTHPKLVGCLVEDHRL